MTNAATGVVELLSEILALLTDDESYAPCALPCFCRVAVYPGLEVALDTCGDHDTRCNSCEGQLWGAIQTVTRIPEAGNTGQCIAYQWTAQVGAVRCAAMPDDENQPPSVDAVQADAAQQAADADGIFRGVLCCPSRSRTIRDAGIVFESWTPITPEGGCVGGYWTIAGRFDVCC